MISPFWYTKLSHSAQNLTLLSAASIPGCELLMYLVNNSRIRGKSFLSSRSGAVCLSTVCKRRASRGETRHRSGEKSNEITPSNTRII